MREIDVLVRVRKWTILYMHGKCNADSVAVSVMDILTARYAEIPKSGKCTNDVLGRFRSENGFIEETMKTLESYMRGDIPELLFIFAVDECINKRLDMLYYENREALDLFLSKISLFREELDKDR